MFKNRKSPRKIGIYDCSALKYYTTVQFSGDDMPTTVQKLIAVFSLYTNPVEVLNNRDFTVIVLHMIANVVVFHVRADVFLHFFTVVASVVESQLHSTNGAN